MLWSNRVDACLCGRGICPSIFAIFLGLSVAALLPAQLSTGTITGTVTDPQSAPVAGVKVLAVETSTNFQARSETNSDGLYRIESLQPGGVARGATVNGGFEVVNVSASASVTHINGSGRQQVLSGGLASGTVLATDPLSL